MQHVSSASVSVDDHVVGAIDHGLLVYVGLSRDDTVETITRGARKLAGARVIWDAAAGNQISVAEAGGSLLLVSQFTLYGDMARGNRPSFSRAMPADEARGLFDQFIILVRAESGVPVEAGEFQAKMLVESVNVGPINLLWES